MQNVDDHSVELYNGQAQFPVYASWFLIWLSQCDSVYG